jgi:hypothetical protein
MRLGQRPLAGFAVPLHLTPLLRCGVALRLGAKLPRLTSGTQPMPDYSSVPQLRVYPMLWQRSLSRHPADWRAQLRSLCALARVYRRDQRAAYRQLPKGEKLFLQALATVDVGDLIRTLESDYPAERNPLLRISPDDPYVCKDDFPGVYHMNGKRYFHA